MRTHITIIILLLASSAYGLTANYNGDCIVNFEDFTIFAASWLDTDSDVDLTGDDEVDLDDLSVFIPQWLDYEGNYGPPTADDVIASIDRGDDGYITLDVTDPNDDTLTCQITSLPVNGATLYDPNGTDATHTDPDSTDPAVIEITSVPYTLVNNENYVLMNTDDTYAGQETFSYTVADGGEPCGGSDSASVTVYCTGDPIAFDDSVECVQYEVSTLELSAVDDTAFTLGIVTEPNGIIKDPFIGARLLSSSFLPWTLRRSGNEVLFNSDTVGGDSFEFKAYDGSTYSDMAEISIDVTANPMDGLYVKPAGQVEIPDDPYFDLQHGWAISFYFRNYSRKPYINPLISKRDGQQGWEVSIMAGKLQFDLYDSDETKVISHRTYFQISDGQWYPILIEYRYSESDPNFRHVVFRVDDDYDWADSVSGSFVNNASVIITGDCGVDHLRFWDDIHSDSPFWPPHSRDDYVETIFGLGNESNVRYKMDEGTGTVIVDDKSNASNGTFDSEDVLWHPPYKIFKSKVKHH